MLECRLLLVLPLRAGGAVPEVPIGGPGDRAVVEPGPHNDRVLTRRTLQDSGKRRTRLCPCRPYANVDLGPGVRDPDGGSLGQRELHQRGRLAVRRSTVPALQRSQLVRAQKRVLWVLTCTRAN